MVISNLNYLEVMSENEIVKGGVSDIFAFSALNVNQTSVAALGFGFAGDDLELEAENDSDIDIN
ncbi:MAG: hypothetical protein ABEI32_10195 [Halothece sp.]